ncbi:Bifunctional chorismate mutase/prephenate dehydratase [Paraconexibacter sp. AEG42_29]|uniref:Prephenate dehydratase n=1 Tax=Paraconexibacter sp. AEG42_29 TaxID=2997339 RepID=A0AAU7ANW9_9ACTN
MRTGYLGPEGTFSHEALLAAGLQDVDAVALSSVHDVVVAVQDGRVRRAIVPIENALEGAVNPTLDALTFDAPDVVLTGELVLAVHHLLLAAGPTPIDGLEVVVSHPQPLAQCAASLRALAPRATPVVASSTAQAVQDVVAEGGPRAAIGTAAAARVYGAHILAEGLEDEPGNATRFVWLARAGDADAVPPHDPAAPARTSVVFHGDGDTTSGWLVRCLSELASRGVNLTKIQSRPLRSALGHYLFHVDLDGRADDPQVAAALSALSTHCETVRILGTYAAAGATIRAGHGGDHTT